jgi:hypothetical protein
MATEYGNSAKVFTTSGKLRYPPVNVFVGFMTLDIILTLIAMIYVALEVNRGMI